MPGMATSIFPLITAEPGAQGKGMAEIVYRKIGLLNIRTAIFAVKY
jgi:hypothetical protein